MSGATTIAAIATPPGEGGLAVIRISGPEAHSITTRVFRIGGKEKTLNDRRAVFGTLSGTQGVVDRAMALYFKAPKSYTGEDIVELSVHGGGAVSQKTLKLVFDAGAVPAAPGEFTRRAFLNGKLDLVQAEAVAQLIRADTDKAHRIAQRQLSGELSARLAEIKTGLRDALALIEVNIDFSEAGVTLFDTPAMAQGLEGLLAELDALLKGYTQGKVAAQGARVALVGPPNAGKSSLFNALCEKERVLVDARAGTTRDTVEETIALDGQRITLVDTAGIRRGGSRVESKGIAHSRAAARTADLVVVVLDAAKKIGRAALRRFESLSRTPRIYVLNKSDLAPALPALARKKTVTTSALKRLGLDELKETILRSLSNGSGAHGDPLISTERQRTALAATREKVGSALLLLRDGSGEELLAVELRAGLAALAQLTGEVTADDVLNLIFGKFCIGK